MNTDKQKIDTQIRQILSMDVCQCEQQEITHVKGKELCIRCGKPIYMPMNENMIQATVDYLQADTTKKYGRNILCFCGSGKKYKNCCRNKLI